MHVHNFIGNWKRLAFVKLQFKKPAIGHLLKFRFMEVVCSSNKLKQT